MSTENKTRSYTFEEVLIDVLQRSATIQSNKLHEVRCVLSSINDNLACIRVALQQMNDCMVETKREEKM